MILNQQLICGTTFEMNSDLVSFLAQARDECRITIPQFHTAVGIISALNPSGPVIIPTEDYLAVSWRAGEWYVAIDILDEGDWHWVAFKGGQKEGTEDHEQVSAEESEWVLHIDRIRSLLNE